MQGKQIKGYTVVATILTTKEMQLFEAKNSQNQMFSLVVIDKAKLEQSAFVDYHNLLSENTSGIHPRYVEPIQSTNNVYIVLQHVKQMSQAKFTPQQILSSLIDLYRHAGELRLDVSCLFLTDAGKVVYLPFYRNYQTTSKFYAQFHNKSIIAEALAPSTTIPYNKLLDIVVNNLDHPSPFQLILSLIEKEIPQSKQGQTQTNQYPSLDEDDEEIQKLMEEARVNNELKQEAGLFQRQSVRRFEAQTDKELNSIMEQAKSSMSSIKKGDPSQLNPQAKSKMKSKMQVKYSKGGIKHEKGDIKLQPDDGAEFQVYFASYHQTLKFMKRTVRVFLEYYRNGFAGIVSSFLILTALVLRKACMIRDLEMRKDIFELDVNMHKISIGRYTSLLGRQLKGDSKMLAQLRVLLQNCEMPVKTFTILAPFLDDISALQLEQVQTFLFFFLSALMKGREKGKLHFLYFIEMMYICLHEHYQIAFFEDEFPNKWDEDYFGQKVLLIQALLPGWRLQ